MQRNGSRRPAPAHFPYSARFSERKNCSLARMALFHATKLRSCESRTSTARSIILGSLNIPLQRDETKVCSCGNLELIPICEIYDLPLTCSVVLSRCPITVTALRDSLRRREGFGEAMQMERSTRMATGLLLAAVGSRRIASLSELRTSKDNIPATLSFLPS